MKKPCPLCGTEHEDFDLSYEEVVTSTAVARMLTDDKPVTEELAERYQAQLERMKLCLGDTPAAAKPS